MPGGRAGWTKLDKTSNTAQIVQHDLNAPETEATIIKTATVPVQQEPPVKPSAALATSSWSNSSASSNASLKKISLSEILKTS